MQGREHCYWALMAFSIFIFAFSVQQGYYDPGNFTWFALVATISASMIFNEIANTVSLRKKRDDASNKKKSSDDQLDKDDPNYKALRSQTNLLETVLRVITYITLGLVIIVSVYVGIKGADHAYYVVFAYFCTAFGAIFPDFLDSTIPGDMRFHRDPWTHSTAIASLVAAGCLLTVDYYYVSLNLFAIAFLLGNTAHLLCDNFESGGTFSDAFVNPIKWRECPGDIRKIREDRERAWLNSQAFMAFVLIAFLSIRYGMASADDGIMAEIVIYDVETSTFSFSTVAIIVLSIIGACYLFTIVSFVAWIDRKKSKATSSREKTSPKKPASSSKTVKKETGPRNVTIPA
jgi:hypothetical protein